MFFLKFVFSRVNILSPMFENQFQSFLKSCGFLTPQKIACSPLDKLQFASVDQVWCQTQIP